MSALRSATRDAWGGEVPDWVEELDRECVAASQNRVAKKIGVSAAMISTVLGHKYAGDMARIEDLVRGHYMNAKVDCPALGEIATNICHDWRKKSRDFSSCNPQRVMMFKACKGCPLNQAEVGS